MLIILFHIKYLLPMFSTVTTVTNKKKTDSQYTRTNTLNRWGRGNVVTIYLFFSLPLSLSRFIIPIRVSSRDSVFFNLVFEAQVKWMTSKIVQSEHRKTVLAHI